MITKTHKVDLGLGVPEKKKKKKKKKVVKEPGTHYSVLSCDDYFVDASPVRAASPSKNMGQAQAHEVLLVKKKKKKKGCGTLFEERLNSEPRLSARRTEVSPSRKKQALGRSESFSKEKKKKRKSSSLITSHGSVTKTSQDTRNGEEEPDTDLEVVLEKKGNMDEAHIDQVRRKALQEEIDRESGKTEASEAGGNWTVSLMRVCEGTQFGQWDTAGFENEEQKLKFLKLMGGFKNLSPSFSRPPSMIGKPNMAMSKKAADTLQQNLQQDYDRAMSWKYNRGAGLGFPTTPSRVFYIDRNASKSVKLED
uniref:Small acidic protein-like domain-containing protein n=1 Tax=Spermophilus dauricus TaxID=99837 RepID=A0A8C9NZL7_SPEDA